MPAIKAISIFGFRGFTQTKTLNPGVPNGTPGSGLTTIVGPNNAGKSSITEAIIAVAQHAPPPFHVGQRNIEAGSRVKIDIELMNGQRRALSTADPGGSPTAHDGDIPQYLVYAVPSRRPFAPAFGAEAFSRDDYAQAVQHQASRQRSVPLHAQLNRLVTNAAEKRAFDAILGELMGSTPDWTIDTQESGQNFLKYTIGKHSHSSDGLGDGVVSLFSIAASLHGAGEGSVIVIDEPELSLHPQLQRRVIKKLVAASAKTQIIMTTHSPLLIDWQSIANGSQVVRVVRSDTGIGFFVLADETKKQIKGLLTDRANPHVLGLDASEVFFYEDGVLMLEGQDDVLLLPEVADQLSIDFRHPMFGWGVGGADKMHIVASILKDMGFKRVAGLIDADKKEAIEKHRKAFPAYSFYMLPAADIRSKPAKKARAAKEGLLDKDGKLRPELAESTKGLLNEINAKLDPPKPAVEGQKAG